MLISIPTGMQTGFHVDNNGGIQFNTAARELPGWAPTKLPNQRRKIPPDIVQIGPTYKWFNAGSANIDKWVKSIIKT